jgi:hypothetical protein
VNRLLRIGSSLAKEPFFQKLTDRKTSSGHDLAFLTGIGTASIDLAFRDFPLGTAGTFATDAPMAGTVTYDFTSAVPEPATLALLGSRDLDSRGGAG